jgi:hypothetical protein
MRRRVAAFTLVEAVCATALALMTATALIHGYRLATRRAEWSGYSLAAHALASMGIEQARACKWDIRGWPVVDELIGDNFPPAVQVLDVPITGTNMVYATNFTTITTVSADPPLKMIRVDCVWPSFDGRLHTNTIVTYRAPDA